MDAIDSTLATSPTLLMAGDLGAGVVDTHRAVADDDADLSADQSPRHAVVVGVHVHAGVVLHAPGQLAHLPERRTAVQRPQRLQLLTLRANDDETLFPREFNLEGAEG